MSEFTPHFAPVVVLLFLGTALRFLLRRRRSLGHRVDISERGRRPGWIP
jgi:hypothetical protein